MEGDVQCLDGSEHGCSEGCGLGQDDFIESGAVDLIAREEDIEARAQLTALREVTDGVVGKPEPQSLFGDVVTIEFGAEAKDAAEEVGADFDGGFADASLVDGRRFHDGQFEAGVAFQDLDGYCGAGECSTYYDDIPILLGMVGLCSHGNHPVAGAFFCVIPGRIVPLWVLVGKGF